MAVDTITAGVIGTSCEVVVEDTARLAGATSTPRIDEVSKIKEVFG